MTSYQQDTSQTSRDADDGGQRHPLSRATYAIGSIVSVGLVIGLGVWGYKLLVRDVSGVPVIRAAEGPMRVQPEDPGGRQALNQGFSVNDVAAVGAAASAPDELILAPAPLDLAKEDLARTASAAPERKGVAQVEDASAESPEAAAPADESAPEETRTSESDMLALANAISDDVTPLEDLPDALDDETAQAADDTPKATSEGAVTASLRPKARPADLRNIREVAAMDPSAQAPRDVDPETIPAGTRLAQLGAFSSKDIAQEEWDSIFKKFAEYLKGKDRVIQRATSGGRTFYRLRAMGFDDLDEARRFCSALVAEKAECIPVVTR